MKKKTVLVSAIISASLLLAVCVGVTVAYLVSQSQTLNNTFTSGNVSITLTESRSDGYIILPGTDISKDPTVTVKAESEACWLFFRLEKTADPDFYLSYGIADGWQPLSGHAGVYYRQVSATDTDLDFPLLTGNKVSVKSTVTEEVLNAITTKPVLKFTAYAVQDESITTATDAYRIILSKEE